MVKGKSVIMQNTNLTRESHPRVKNVDMKTDKNFYRYDTDLFTNRKEEIGQLRGKILEARKPDSGESKVIVFRGVRGSGKSWLAMHLHRKVIQEELTQQGEHINSFLVMLDPKYPETKKRECIIDSLKRDASGSCHVPFLNNEADACVSGLLYRMIEQLDEDNKPDFPIGTPLHELSSNLVQLIKEWLSTQPESVFVLFVDSILEKQYHTLLPALETYLLDPLARLSHVLLVLTGRSQTTGLTKPFVRPKTRDVEILKSFTATHIIEQIKKHIEKTGITYEQSSEPQIEKIAQTITELSNGHPEVIASIIAKILPEKSDLSNIQPSSITAQVRGLYSELVDAMLGTDQAMRTDFEAICILNGFKKTEAKVMIDTYVVQTKRQHPGDIGEIIDRLVSTSLVFFESGLYRVNASLRFVLEKYIEFNHPELWKELHNQAQQMYESWSVEYKEHEEYFQNRALLHAGALQQVQFEGGGL